MEVTGTIIQIDPVQEITSTNGESFKKQNVIIETAGEFPKKICLTAATKLIDSIVMLEEGQTITASVNLESREYNGKWYNDIKMWKFI